MMNRIEQIADNLKAESRQLADRAVAGLRNAGLETADFISRTKGPVHSFADTTLKFNTQTHKRFERVLKQQVKLLDGLIDGSADRIEKVAKAKDVNALKNIVVDISSIGGAKKAPARKKRATRKTAAKKRPATKAKATSKKASTRKTTARKATARKATTKKRATRKAAPSQAATSQAA